MLVQLKSDKNHIISALVNMISQTFNSLKQKF